MIEDYFVYLIGPNLAAGISIILMFTLVLILFSRLIKS